MQNEEEIDLLAKKQPWNHDYDFLPEFKYPASRFKRNGVASYKWRAIESLIDVTNYRGKTVIDVGCGDGYFSNKFASAGASTVLGVDLDETRIEKANFARKFYGIQNADFRVASIESDQVNRKYDLGLCLGLLHRVVDHVKIIEFFATNTSETIFEFKKLRGSKPVCIWAGGATKLNSFNKLCHIMTLSYFEGLLQEHGMAVKATSSNIDFLKYPRVMVHAAKV